MKQISEMKEKPFTLSLKSVQNLLDRGVEADRVTSPPSAPPYFPADPWIFF
jgi:hypothetical protein